MASNYPTIAASDHRAYMEYAMEHARLSPLTPTQFCVGAVFVDADRNEILSTGRSMELPDNNPADPGNTHAEQCCIIKVAQKHHVSEERLIEVLPKNTVLYTTMEPCSKRSISGNRACVDRILSLKDSIRVVYIGMKHIDQPEDVLVEGRKRMRDAGVEVVFLEGMEDRILGSFGGRA